MKKVSAIQQQKYLINIYIVFIIEYCHLIQYLKKGLTLSSRIIAVIQRANKMKAMLELNHKKKENRNLIKANIEY